jgi:hypothetical protein
MKTVVLYPLVFLITSFLLKIFEVLETKDKTFDSHVYKELREPVTTNLFSLYYRYVPTRLWGFSGHVQTIIHSIIGRVRCPWPIGERCYLSLCDGTTLTYDVYQPLDQSHEGKKEKYLCTLVI